MGSISVVLAALTFASIATATGCSTPPTLRSNDVQDQIAAGLEEQVGGDFTVICPTGVPARAGTTFTCMVTDESDRSTIMVTVTELDDTGGFDWRVQAPSAPALPAVAPT